MYMSKNDELLAQIVLTSTESKKLIAKAVVANSQVQYALRHGIIMIHPSSTTAWIYEEIMGSWPEEPWVFGLVTPKGLSRSKSAVESMKAKGGARKQWVFIKGVLQDTTDLNETLLTMTSSDVFIKSCNALDNEGNTAVLTTTPHVGGTIGRVLKAQKERGFQLIIPIGLEKLIPGTIKSIYKSFESDLPECGTGLFCGIFPVLGEKMDERDALHHLCAVDAIAVSAGGIVGAEGGVTLFVKDEKEKVLSVLALIDTVKDARLPQLEYVTY